MKKYIDADELIFALNETIEKHKDSEMFTRTIRAPENMITIIKRMHSADVRENIHGEWIYNKNNDVIKCSECGFGILDGTFVWNCRNCYGTIEDNPFNFCPKCGADMRERK